MEYVSIEKNIVSAIHVSFFTVRNSMQKGFLHQQETLKLKLIILVGIGSDKLKAECQSCKHWKVEYVPFGWENQRYDICDLDNAPIYPEHYACKKHEPREDERIKWK